MAFDLQFYDLLWDVHSYQQCCRIEWVHSHAGESVFLGGFFLANLMVPVYDDYNKTWSDAGHVNPFEFDWLGFGRDLDLGYIELVLDTLFEQLVIWGVDKSTSSSWIYDWVVQFFDGLSLLYSYCLRKGILAV